MASKEGKMEEEEPPADTSAWMVTFSDLLTLMITFFVLLLSMASMDTKSLKNMSSSFEESLGVLEMGSKGEVKKIKILGSVELISQELLMEMRVIRNILDELVINEDEVSSALLKGSQDFKDIVTVDDRGLVITLTDAILFDSGQTELKKESYPLIDEIAKRLEKTKFHLSIEGHSDSTSSGPDSSNWIISAKRATSVMLHMNRELGIDMSRLSARGFSQYSPIVDNSTSENRAKNRRIEIILTKEL